MDFELLIDYSYDIDDVGSALAEADSAPRKRWKVQRTAQWQGHTGPRSESGSAPKDCSAINWIGISRAWRAGPMPLCVEATHCLRVRSRD